MKELKDRFCAVTRAVLQARYPLGDPAQKAHIAALAYDKTKVLNRRAQLDALWARSEDAIRVRLFLDG